MTNPVRGVLALPRRLMRAGDAGEAGDAGSRLIATNVLIQITARVITMAIGVVTVSLTARTLGTEGYGVWSSVSNYTGLFAVLTDLGFVTIATQRMAAEPDREGNWLGALVGIRVTASLAVAATCAASVPLLLRSTGDSHAVAYIMTSTILTVGAASLLTVYESRLRSGVALTLTVLQWCVWLAAVVVLHLEHASVVAFAAVNAAIMFVIAGLQIRVSRRSVRIAWRAGRRLWTTLLRHASPLGVATIMMAVYYQVDSVLLLQLAGAREAGIYGAAYGFLSPLLFLPAAIMGSFFPVLAAIQEREPQRMRRLVQVCADVMAMIGLPILAGSIALAGPIIHLIYGAEFTRSAGLLPILMLAFLMMCFGNVGGNLSILLGLRWRFALYATIGAAANVALNLVLIPPYGAYGSAWVTVVTESLTMVLMLFTSLRAMRLRLNPDKALRTVALAAGMTGVMIFAKPLGLVPTGLLGMIAYAGGLMALRIVDREELRALTQRSRRHPAEPVATPQ